MPEMTFADPVLGPPFAAAFDYALERHRHDARKGTKTPYIAHLLQVTGLVLEAGGSEEQAIAALLHDTIEDAASEEVPIVKAEIRARFGERVLEIVLALSDSEGRQKRPWRVRKEAYLEQLRQETDTAVLEVSLADKVHNATAIVRDLKTHGPSVWERFQGRKDGTLWYYGQLTTAYRLPADTPLLRELCEVVRQMQELAARS